MLPDWRALVIRMNLRPVVVKVRPAWRRLAYRLGRHPLPVPACLPAAWPLPAAARTRPRPRAPEPADADAARPDPPRRTATAASPGRWLRRNVTAPAPAAAPPWLVTDLRPDEIYREPEPGPCGCDARRQGAVYTLHFDPPAGL